MNIKDIENPKFLKKLNEEQLNVLASDVRSFIIDTVSKTGGHLSSNLGVVELTIALHYCFDMPKDKILFDVGHQCYTHKILTGRAKQMEKMRSFGGISGFQKRIESEYDCFEAGHSSTSLPIALGMAKARDLNNDDYYVIPVIGDGSLGNGLSLEALNQIGFQKTKMIIVFNDNNMSISRNVGALNESISKLRNSNQYNSLKNKVKNLLKKLNNGDSIINSIHNIKEKIKGPIIDSNVFGEFGIYYIGPVDGHDIKELIRAFEVAKTKNMPVVVHCITKKGKGYKFCEDDTSGRWHGVGRFDVSNGKFESISNQDKISYSQLVSNVVENEMANDKNIVTITPAMISGSCLENIFKRFPNRSYDVGISEDLAIDFACGLSLGNKKPFVSIYSSFLQRAYDQLNHDIARMNLPVVVGIDRCSLVGEDGETHHGVFDISLLSALPNIVLAEGRNAQEIGNLFSTAFKSNMPFFIRYPRDKVLNDINYEKIKTIKIGSWEKVMNNNNPDFYILSYGNDVNKICDYVKEKKYNCNVINCRFIKPLDKKLLLEIAKNNKPVFIYTGDIIKGGLGNMILEFYNSNNINIHIENIGIDDKFVTHGSINDLKKSLKIDIESLFKTIDKNIKA